MGTSYFSGIFRSIIAISIVILLASCGGGGGGGSSNNTTGPAVLAPNAIDLDNDSINNLSSVSEDGMTLFFSSVTAQLDTLKEDDVIISGITPVTPRGLLRKVVSINRLSDGSIQVATSPATLTDAFQELHLSGTISSLANTSMISAGTNYIMSALGLSAATVVPKISFKIQPISISTSSDYDSTLSGDYSFSPDLEYEIDISEFHLNKFKLAFVGDATLDIDGTWSADNAKKISLEAPLSDVPIIIGPPIAIGPVVLTIEFIPSIGDEFSCEGNLDLTAGFTSSCSITAGFEYDDDEFSPLASYEGIFDPYYTIDDQVGFTASPYFRAKLGVYIYDAAGPYVDLQPYGKVKNVITSPPHIERSYGIKGNVGGQVKVLTHALASVSLQLFDINIPLNETLYAVSGKIESGGEGLQGVRVTLAGNESISTITDATGGYAFTDARKGSYTLTPSLAGYTFSPSSISVSVNNGNVIVSTINAVASQVIGYTVSGRVTSNGSGLAGVTVTLSGNGSRTTDGTGTYTFTNIADGSYTLTFSSADYSFNPSSINVTVNNGNYSAGNIVATASSGLAFTSQVAAGLLHTVGLKSDGTVVAVGNNGAGESNVGGWTGITQVSAGVFMTVGLKSDGTVVAVGVNDYGQCNVGDWSGIIQVSAGNEHTVGLKSDGTVVAVGYNFSGGCNVGDWTGITHVSAGYNHTVGLKSDGTVVAVGWNGDGQCNMGEWTGIIQVSAGGEHTVGLKSDGTVVAVGNNEYGQCNVGDWTGITQVAARGLHTVGLKSDGTVVAVGYNNAGLCNVNDWTGITQIAAGLIHTVGLKSDGTVVAVGNNEYGQCNVGDWNLEN